MGTPVTTIVVEPRYIVREALASLMRGLRYRVSGSVATPADITDAVFAGEGCKLVILGAASAEDGAKAAIQVRELCQNCKIILILEFASCADLQGLVNSDIDGCIPLEASADTLSKALELIIVQQLRVMITCSSRKRLVPVMQGDVSQRLLNGIEDKALSIVIGDRDEVAAEASGASSVEQRYGDRGMNGVLPHGIRGLSERELQILDSLVKGHANKVIARKCAISEATVKVHMKSILRKIRVANRTQAAVWALEHGYCDDGSEVEPGSQLPTGDKVDAR